MTTIDTHKPGSFCWIELGTSNQPAAKNFYQKLFGWSADDTPMGPNELYTTFKLNGREAAAGYTLRPGQVNAGVPPHWMLYIAVANCDNSAKRVADVGGTVLMAPFDVFTLGRMAVCQDPTGAVFCIWEAKQHVGLRIEREEGAFCWADLLTPDRDRASDFYSSLFGWTIEREGAAQHDYYHIRNGQDPIAGMPAPNQQLPGTHPHWSIYFQTAACEKRTSQAQSLGAKILKANWKHENVGTLSIAADPQGATFCIFESARRS